MSRNTVISVRISDEMDKQIATLAHLRGRSRSWIVNEALSRYIDSEKRFINVVQQGLQDIDDGSLVPNGVVLQEIRDLIASVRMRETGRP